MEFNEIDNELLKSHYNYKDLFKPYNIDYNSLNTEYTNSYDNNRYVLTDNEMYNEPSLFTLQKEISIADMNKVISLILMKYDTIIEKDKGIYNFLLNTKRRKLNKNINYIIAYHLLNQINETVLQNKLMGNTNHYASLFKIININLTPKIDKKKHKSSNARFYLEIGRDHKLYSFNIEVIASYHFNTLNEELQYKYNLLQITGINNNYKHILHNNSNLDNFNNNKNYYPIRNRNDRLTKIKEPNQDRVINIDKKIGNNDQFQKNLSNIKLLYPNTGCFIVNKNTNRIKELEINNPLECESYHEEYKSNGVWDKRCTKNKECPFYDKTRKLGGCNNGICNMPVGVTRIGYRHYLKDTKPECDNCDLYNPYCCYDNDKYKTYTKTNTFKFL